MQSISGWLPWFCLGLTVFCLTALGSNLFAAEPAAPAATPAATARPADADLPTPMMRGLGIVTHFGRGPNWDVDKVLPLVQKMGVSVIRDGPEWAGIEREKGVYVIPEGTQHMFDAVTKAGIRLMFTVFRRNTLYENPLDPDACARYAAFMAKTWKPPEICAYEIWNEPPNFDFPQQYKGKTWLPKYCEMVRKVAAAIREVQPKAVILHNVEGREWLEALQKYPQDFAQVDGIDMHPYPKRNPAESFSLTTPAVEYPKKYLGRELQMWVGEYGYPTMKDTPGAHWMGVTEETQAAYQVRGLLMGLQAGVKAWCIYDMVDEGTSPTDNEDNMGLVRNISRNHEPKPAFYSLQRVARLMGPDWQMAPDVKAKLDVTLPPEAEDRHVKITGPEALWFRVGKDYVTFVWKAGWFVAEPNPPLGKIVWTGAPKVTSVQVQDLVSGKTVDAKLSGSGTVTLSGVPVGSAPVAIHWIVGK